MKKLFGVITAMTTPFTQDGKVDTAALEAQTEFLIQKGVQCLYPCGTTGEMYLMSAGDRELVAETVVKKAAGRVTVFIHCGAMTEEETIRLAQHAHKIGADGVGVVTPSYFGISPRAMVEYYKRVCAALPQDFSVYVYVIPQLAKNDITAQTMEEIAAACKNVVGVKYSWPDVRRVNEYLQVRGGEFSVVPGADDLFLPCLVCGCDGVVSRRLWRYTRPSRTGTWPPPGRPRWPPPSWCRSCSSAGTCPSSKTSSPSGGSPAGT